MCTGVWFLCVSAWHQSRAQRWAHVEGGEWLVRSVCWWTIMTITQTAARWQ